MYLAKNQVYRSKSNVGKRLKSRLEPWWFDLGSYAYDAQDHKVADNDKNVEG
jgi:hypothetical protein